MPREFELPTELIDFESQLRSTTPPALAVNRDELMFRAGAASVLHDCKTQVVMMDEVLSDERPGKAASPSPSLDCKASKTSTVWPWQLATGVLAAILVWMVAFPSHSSLPGQASRDESVIASVEAIVVPDEGLVTEPVTQPVIVHSAVREVHGWWPHRRLDRLNRFAEIESGVWNNRHHVTTDTTEVFVPPKTYRQVLNELLSASGQPTTVDDPDSL